MVEWLRIALLGMMYGNAGSWIRRPEGLMCGGLGAQKQRGFVKVTPSDQEPSTLCVLAGRNVNWIEDIK